LRHAELLFQVLDTPFKSMLYPEQQSKGNQEDAKKMLFGDGLRAREIRRLWASDGLCGSNSRRRDLRHYFLFADNPEVIQKRGSMLLHPD
jgi:hypothetical protein